MMKKLKKIDLDKISRWEEIPLTETEKNKRMVRDDSKIIIIPGYYNSIKGEDLNKLRSILSSTEEIYIRITTDHDGFVDDLIFKTSYEEKDLMRIETDAEYIKRIENLQMRYWDALCDDRNREANIEKTEKALFKKLKNKYG